MFINQLLLILILLQPTPKVYSYDAFVQRFERQFARDAWMRPSDSLFYVPTVKLCSIRNHNKASVDERRQQFFYHLSRHRVRLAYNDAYDLKNTKRYYNYSMDWLNNLRRPYTMSEYIEARSGVCDSIVILRGQALINYIKEYSPEYVFHIETMYTDGPLYWAIRDGFLFAVDYDIHKNSFIEYEADAFLKTIAEDSLFEPLGIVY